LNEVFSKHVKDLSTVSAAILAGGLGTRLRSAVGDRPKVLADIGGRPFLAYLLDQLLNYDVNLVVLCIGYKGEQVRTEFGDTYEKLKLAYSQEISPLGTAGALRLALPLFKSESVLVLNGDSFCDADLEDFWQWHLERRADASLLLTQVSDTRRFGRVDVDSEGRLIGFAEKGSDDGPGWVNAGIYLLRRRLLETIPPERAVSLEHEMFPIWIERGLYGYRALGSFIDIGTPESYVSAQDFFSSQKLA
jgi:D-glycero-alpha-D-manno-heptose 1-phosphate guanylyltransferase